MLKKYKLLIYPIIIILIGIILSAFHLHGSAIGRYSEILFPNQEDTNIILGHPRATRSDEFLFGTPILLSQDINDESMINTDIGEGTNLGYSHNVPTRDIFTFFEPASWPFLLSDNTNLSYAIHWWSRIILMLLGTYFLLFELTNKNFLLSISGSLLFLVTPFVQWWLSADPMAPIGLISFGLFFFIKLVKSKKIFSYIGYSLALAYTIISFGLILYPPFQIPLAIVTVFLAIGIVIKERKEFLNNKKSILLFISSLALSLAIVISFVLIFYTSFKDVISIMTNTVYPGERFVTAGLGNPYQIFDGFYDILMQSDSNGAPYANQCEASNFFMIFIPLIIWMVYKNIINLRTRKKVDIIGISIAAPLLLFFVWSLLPLPDFISKYSGLYMVPPQRLLLAMGFSNYFLLLYMFSSDTYKFDKKKILDKILSLLLILFNAILTFLTGRYLYSLNPTFFTWPTSVLPYVKILLATILVSTLIFMFLRGYKKLFMIVILLFGLISTVYVNPLYKGLDVLTDTDLANYITDLSTDDDSKWVIYGDHHYAQYALANNANILNGIHPYPQFEIWSVIDSEKEYHNIYNRYAHVLFFDLETGEEPITLIQNDLLVVNISPCDSKLKDLGVKYVLSTINFQDSSCLEKQKQFGNATIYLLK